MNWWVFADSVLLTVWSILLGMDWATGAATTFAGKLWISTALFLTVSMIILAARDGA
jgi:hypothetical protein